MLLCLSQNSKKSLASLFDFFLFFFIILKAWQVYLKKSATQYFILHGWICDRDPYCDLVPIGCGFQVTLEMIK